MNDSCPFTNFNIDNDFLIVFELLHSFWGILDLPLPFVYHSISVFEQYFELNTHYDVLHGLISRYQSLILLWFHDQPG